MDDARTILSTLLPNLDDRDRWLQTAYAETWKQLSHQDQLAASRSSVFLAVQAALLAALAALSLGVAKIGCATLFTKQVHFGMLLAGVLWIIVPVILSILSRQFVRVTKSAQNYIALRKLQLRAIELMVLPQIGPAMVEKMWRDHSDKSTDVFKPFAHIKIDDPKSREIRSWEISAYENYGNFRYLYAVVRVWRALYALAFVVGCGLLSLGLWLSKLDPSFVQQVCK